MSEPLEPVSVIGGTGDFGHALCRHFARHNVKTVIGSREASRARDAAGALDHTSSLVTGAVNRDAIEQGRLVVLTLPYAARDALLEPMIEDLAGKIVVDTTVPLDPDRPDRYREPAAGSAALQLRELLGEGRAKLVSGFHTLGAHSLRDPSVPPPSDAFYCGDTEGKNIVANLLDRLGWTGHDAGDLQRSRTLERLTPMMIHFNHRYEQEGLGLTLTGFEETSTGG